jgi:hypothetical protein
MTVKGYNYDGSVLWEKIAVSRQLCGEGYLPDAWHVNLAGGGCITSREADFDQCNPGWRDLPAPKDPYNDE